MLIFGSYLLLLGGCTDKQESRTCGSSDERLRYVRRSETGRNSEVFRYMIGPEKGCNSKAWRT
jgi:hypothetical protein